MHTLRRLWIQSCGTLECTNFGRRGLVEGMDGATCRVRTGGEAYEGLLHFLFWFVVDSSGPDQERLRDVMPRCLRRCELGNHHRYDAMVSHIYLCCTVVRLPAQLLDRLCNPKLRLQPCAGRAWPISCAAHSLWLWLPFVQADIVS